LISVTEHHNFESQHWIGDYVNTRLVSLLNPIYCKTNTLLTICWQVLLKEGPKDRFWIVHDRFGMVDEELKQRQKDLAIDLARWTIE